MRMIAGLGIVVLMAMWMAPPAGAQEIERGAWTGTLTPPGADVGVPVTYVVGDTDGALSIVMNNPQLGDIGFNDLQLEENELKFWWEPGVRVDCTLTRQSDGSFGGPCSDGSASGEDGILLMLPPSD
ncbi:MAG TPA: hypothetical protein EYQ64_14735 [Gemmatimonadetes bacterium]|nr:hypothetical protein [Gemmatimonadota bacterium]